MKWLVAFACVLLLCKQSYAASFTVYQDTVSGYNINLEAKAKRGMDYENSYNTGWQKLAVSRYVNSVADCEENTYLKFKITDIDLTKEKIVSVDLKLYRYSKDGSQNIGVYYTPDDSWNEDTQYYNDYIYPYPSFDKNSVLAMDIGSELGWTTLHLNLSDELLNDIKSGNFISLALYAPVATSVGQWTVYYNREYQNGLYGAQLTVNTDAVPTPEPSSSLLGLLGFVAIRRRRAL